MKAEVAGEHWRWCLGAMAIVDESLSSPGWRQAARSRTAGRDTSGFCENRAESVSGSSTTAGALETVGNCGSPASPSLSADTRLLDELAPLAGNPATTVAYETPGFRGCPPRA